MEDDFKRIKGLIRIYYNLNSIFYITVLMLDSEGKTEKNVMKNTYKGLTINCNGTEYMALSKRESPRCDLHFEDVKIKQVQKLN